VIDPEKAATVSRLQACSPCWLVMWSTYHMTFTAFAAFAPVPLVLDDADADRLAVTMRQEELRYGYAAFRPVVQPLPRIGASIQPRTGDSAS
jgi:hypothetical protein